MTNPSPGGHYDPYQPSGTPDPYQPSSGAPDPYHQQPTSGGGYQPQSPYGQPDPQQGYYQDPANPAGGYPAAGYPAPGYPAPGYPATSTNVMAILSLVFAFVFSPAGIVLGHLAKKQIRQTGEQGDQLATWGLVLSYIFTGLSIVACCGFFGLAILSANSNGSGSY